MAYEEKHKQAEAHHLIMEGREKLSISGVMDVESFDENVIVMYTAKGLLTVQGEGLHIERLSIEGGEVSVEGFVDGLQYEEEGSGRRSLLARLFK